MAYAGAAEERKKTQWPLASGKCCLSSYGPVAEHQKQELWRRLVFSESCLDEDQCQQRFCDQWVEAGDRQRDQCPGNQHCSSGSRLEKLHYSHALENNRYHSANPGGVKRTTAMLCYTSTSRGSGIQRCHIMMAVGLEANRER